MVVGQPKEDRNSHSMMTEWHIFSQPIVLKVSGKDARRYLHNRLSNDIRALELGQSVRAAALTAQGRVEGLFTVFCAGSDLFFLACDGGDAAGVRAALSRFIVADRVSVEDVSESSVFVHAVGTTDSIRSAVAVSEPARLLCADNSRLAEHGTDLLIVGIERGAAAKLLREKLPEPMLPARYELLRIKHGTPAYPDEVNEGIILTESGLYDAVSFSKGCYVGQEVLERSDAIGKLPRALERIQLSGLAAPPAGMEVCAASKERIGQVVSAAPDPEGPSTFVFALLRSGKYCIGDAVTCAGASGAILGRAKGTGR